MWRKDNCPCWEVPLITLSHLAMEEGLTGLEFAGGIPISRRSCLYEWEHMEAK